VVGVQVLAEKLTRAKSQNIYKTLIYLQQKFIGCLKPQENQITIVLIFLIKCFFTCLKVCYILLRKRISLFHCILLDT